MTIPIPPPPGAFPVAQENTLGNLREEIESKGRLSDNEYSFILDTTLRTVHREDPSVLAFIDSFVRCKSVSQAAAEAGVNQRIGMQYRNRNDIALAIQKLTEKSFVKYGFDASEIVERVKEHVDFDPIEIQNPDGTFKNNFHDIAPEARRSIKSLVAKNLYNQVEDINGVKSTIVIGQIIKYEFYDKQKAIDQIGKEKDLFKTTTKVEHTISNDMANILLESAKRGAQASLAFKDIKTVQGYVVNNAETEENDE